jgi:hypothetical protein
MPTTDVVATLKASLERKEPAKATPTKADQKTAAPKQPARRRRASSTPAERASATAKEPVLTTGLFKRHAFR